MGARLIRPWPSDARHATLARVEDGNGEQIDEGIVVLYRAPASFTVGRSRRRPWPQHSSQPARDPRTRGSSRVARY
jgi:hypothetical protein